MMNAREMRRRSFLQTASVGTAGLALAGPAVVSSSASEKSGKLAVLGGNPIRTKPFPSWPIIEKKDEEGWLEVLRARKWFRMNGDKAAQFEKRYAALTGAKECLATNSGTNALFTSLNALDIGPGDEVLVPPYTFVATINVVFLQYALPVFVDTDPETFQMDARKLEDAITERTRCIIPVHLGGNAVDMDTVLAVAQKHNLCVIEDACQAHLGEWRGRKAGTLGDTGCFSFQVSKNLCCGDGGAIISNNTELMDRCYSFHSNGRERIKTSGFGYVHNGTNVRMTEFQAAVLLAQMTRLEEQSRTREQNAAYLTNQLEEIPGILPAKMYEGCTRNAYHLYMFRYDEGQFAGVPRGQFMKALRAEGIPCSGGYSPLNKNDFVKNTLSSRGFQAVYSRERIDRYFEENHCPENDRLCEEAVWFFQTMLIGSRKDMDQIAEAIRKIRGHADELAKV